ncbi:MAG: acyltransferase [Prevotella sp.]|nr:acyltransferase [Prevotella sp.]
MNKKARDISVDILKLLAVVCVINSHLDVAYGKYALLATGGAIGDNLFLFCSGFTLFLGNALRFDLYYKRRINRIYPSVFAALFIPLILGLSSFSSLTIRSFTSSGFIEFIMIYYVILWFVRMYFRNKIWWVFFLLMTVTLAAYYPYPYKYGVSSDGLYDKTDFRWIPYFGSMLLGAYIGSIREKLRFNIKKDLIKLIVCLLLFYGIQLLAMYYTAVAPWQIVTLLPLYGVVYYTYKCCNGALCRRLYNTKTGNAVIMIIGGLCLETYLIQFRVIALFGDKLNFLFPLNIILIFITSVAAAYVVRCFARLFSQTFRTEDYEWRKVFSLYL